MTQEDSEYRDCEAGIWSPTNICIDSHAIGLFLLFFVYCWSFAYMFCITCEGRDSPHQAGV
jgi:hypothetical protein